MSNQEPAVVETEGAGTQHVWTLPTDETTLLDLITTVFTDHWQQINFGPIIEGAAWEVGAPCAPTITTSDGYATIDFGDWHFHLCIGEHRASGEELSRIRRCSRAELYRSIGRDGSAVSWGFRMFNGRNEQMMTILLPNPFLTDRQEIRKAPDFDRLAAWDALRARFLDLPADPFDRSGKGFRHSR